MLLFIICLVLTIGGFILGKYFYDHYWRSEIPSIISYAVAISSLIIVMAFGIVALSNTVDEDAYLAEQQVIYDSLVYQIENNLYDNDNDIGKSELMQRVTEWNSELSKCKILSNNIWCGMLYYQCYDQLQLIPLKAIE